MSMSFEVFPTRNKVPDCDEIILYSVQLFSEFMKRENIAQNIKITVSEVSIDNEICQKPISLTSNENYCTVIKLNEVGEVYVYYHKLSELDKEFWDEELQGNMRARSVKEKICANLKIGYSWSVKRTMGQPAIVSLYYGYLAIAIAVCTDGIIYSDDGAWDYTYFPIDGKIFEEKYLNIGNMSDVTVKANIEKWLVELKASGV